MNIIAEEELKRILGDRLAAKIIDDCQTAADEFAKNLYEMAHKAMETRIDLCRDELNEPRHLPVQDEAVRLLTHVITSHLSCRVLGLACVLHVAMDKRMSVFVAHAAEHYETELERHKAERIGGLLNTILGSRDDVTEEQIHTAARAHSSRN